MKIKELLLILCMVTGSMLFAQGQLPVIHATSSSAFIFEGKDKMGWWLDPGIRPDVHVITKSPKAKWITFCTDIDSIKTQLKPGQQFDFIVLLNGKDSCYTRLKSEALVTTFSKQFPASHDTIPFELTEYNNIKLKVILNQTDTLFLKFDSGATGLLLTHEAIAQKTKLLSGQAGVREGISKPDYNKMHAYNRLDIGGLSWDSLAVYPVVLSGQGTDGRFGWDLFDGRIVEMDFDHKRFIVHTALPKKIGTYTRLPIDYTHGLFCIPGVLEVKGKKYKNRFLYDNGYQRTIMLDSSLLLAQKFPTDLKVIKKTIMKNGQGKAFPVITVNNEKLLLGDAALPDIPAQKLTIANPAGFPVHILGNEVLKRFNTIIDFQKNFIYLKTNQLISLPYAEAS